MRTSPLIAIVLVSSSLWTGKSQAQDTCTGANAEKIKLIEDTHRDRWTLYPDSRQIMLDEMSQDLVSFYGINTQLFYWELRHLQGAFGADYQLFSDRLGIGPIFGDAHFGNLGIFEGEDGETLYAINDYDDATIGPRIFDIIRGAASLPLHFSSFDSRKLLAAFVEGYASAYIKMLRLAHHDVDAAPTTTQTLVDKNTNDEPAPPPESWEQAKIAIAAIAGFSPGEFADHCKKFVYAPFHGGSSLGLPRFRAKCDGVVYEIKSCVGSAVDQSQGIASSCSQGDRISTLAKKLAPDFVGPFEATTVFSNIPEFAQFGFYGHLRNSEHVATADLDEEGAIEMAHQLGESIGDGHVKSREDVLHWDPTWTASMKRMLVKVVVPTIDILAKDFDNLPNCLR